MASSAIESAIKYLGQLLVEEVQFLAKVKDEVEKLQTELKYMQCFLKDVDVKQNKSALLQESVFEIKDLALKAEDLVESYILEVSHKRQNKGLLDYLKWLICCLGEAKTLHNVRSDIDALSAKISNMSSRLQRYGVKSSYSKHSYEVVMDENFIAEQRRTYAHVENKIMVGLEESVAQLKEILQESKQNVVVVHGLGGIGKTTLAREVFHDKTFKSKFKGVAWAYVSQQLQLGSVCREILRQLNPEIIQNSQLQDSELPGKLYEILKQKKCLVVLDDVWKHEDWKRLEPCFPIHDSLQGSKLLITTRDPQILSGLPGHLVHYYRLNFLNHDKSWELLQKTSHFDKDKPDSEKVELGNKMLDHCKGLPLAIAVLGGVLATKDSVDEWQSVYDNLPSHLQGDGSYSGVYEVLAMSYYELPYHLKPCFLLLGYFPEDFDIPTEKLYHLWIAEGLIPSTLGEVATKRSSGRSLEDICKAYLNELVQKGMVQVGKWDKFGEIKICRLHDLMRDKCLEINEKENFLQIFDYHTYKKEYQPKVNVPNKNLRRMSIYGDDIPINSPSRGSPHIRSILFIPLQKIHIECQDCGCIVPLCKDFKLLRVLYLEGLFLKGCLPTEVGSLIFLRYLSLKDTHIGKLPPSIAKLSSLLILDLRVQYASEIPNVIWKMKSLRHLYFPSSEVCGSYHIKGGQMLKLGQLIHLEKLEGVQLDTLDVEGLENLAGSLRKLDASCRKNNNLLLVPFIKSKSIKSLILHINGNIVKEKPKILSACDSLKGLVIYDVPKPHVPLPLILDMFPQSLVSLSIIHCKFSEDPMPILGKLSKLKKLKLFNECYDGNELVCTENGFPELTYLNMCGLSSLKNWTVEKGCLPKLQQLEILHCPFLGMLPEALPSDVSIRCSPCVRGIERYNTCRHFEGVFGGADPLSHELMQVLHLAI